jgi:hypothetical protein
MPACILSDFHGDNTGSNPVGDAKLIHALRTNSDSSTFNVSNATVTIEPELVPLSGFSSAFPGDSAYAPSRSLTASERKAGLRC